MTDPLTPYDPQQGDGGECSTPALTAWRKLIRRIRGEQSGVPGAGRSVEDMLAYSAKILSPEDLAELRRRVESP